MRRHRLWTVVVLSVLLGCSGHYWEVKNSTLDIYLEKAEAQSVYFLYSADGYVLRQARKTGRKTWVVRLPVPHGNEEFKYFYIIDGKPFVPECRFREKDGFGSEVCIYVNPM